MALGATLSRERATTQQWGALGTWVAPGRAYFRFHMLWDHSFKPGKHLRLVEGEQDFFFIRYNHGYCGGRQSFTARTRISEYKNSWTLLLKFQDQSKITILLSVVVHAFNLKRPRQVDHCEFRAKNEIFASLGGVASHGGAQQRVKGRDRQISDWRIAWYT